MLLNEVSAFLWLVVNPQLLKRGHAFFFCSIKLSFIMWLLLTDGQRVANTTLIDTLLDKDFQLIVNDKVYDVKSPEKGEHLAILLSAPSLLFSSSFVLSSPPSQRARPVNMQWDWRM